MNVNRIARIAAVSIACAGLGLAHHGLDSQFDTNHEITISGTVTKVAWINPHVRFFVDVKDTSGQVSNWEVDMGSANDQMLRGWKIDSFRKGDSVSIDAYPAKNGSHLGFAKKIARTGP